MISKKLVSLEMQKEALTRIDISMESLIFY